MDKIIDRLLSSEEPSIVYKTRVNILNENPESEKIKKLQEEIFKSERVRKLLSNTDNKGRIKPVNNPYKKWYGAHWILARLADIGYPGGQKELLPLREQVYNCWLNPGYIEEFQCEKKSDAYSKKGVPVIKGKARRHASQQGNALYATLALGIADKRAEKLAKLLIRWQWPDGGWNCDKNPDAKNSSFWETLIPLRALSLYSKIYNYEESKKAAKRAAEIFLKRNLFKRQKDGQVMNPEFIQLHYPCYYKYDILFGLKVMVESGYINDNRCKTALDILERKRLDDGGWPVEARFYKNGKLKYSQTELVSWGRVNKKNSNEWVTVDSLYVLKEAKRL
ncbi:MAG: hypothetical protein ACOC1S_03155 [bacterium]